jgi:MFS family permease
MTSYDDGPAPSTRDVLTRDFILAFLGFFIFLFCYFALMPTLPLFLSRLGSSEREIGVIVGAYGVSSLVSRIIAGGALSRYSEKPIMISAALLFAATFFACLLFRPFWPLVAIRLLQGISYAFFDTAIFALVIKMTSPSRRGRTLSYFMLAPGIGTVLAPSGAMFLVNSAGFPVLFLSTGVFALVAVALAATVKVRSVEVSEGAPSQSPSGADEKKRISFVEKKIIVPAVSAFFYYFSLGSVMAFFPLYAVQRGMENPGYFFSASALMTIAGRFLGARIVDSWSKEKTILTFTTTSLVSMLLLSVSGSAPAFIAVGVLWGTSVAFIFPVTLAYGFEYAGASGGTAVGTFRVLTDFGTAAGPMVMGILLPLTGYPVMFLCLAAVFLINLCYFQFFVKKRRMLRSWRAPESHR